MTDRDTSALIRWMPAVFVLIWATGFIVARYGMPHAPPFTFLLIRYLLSIVCFGVWIAIARVLGIDTRLWGQWLIWLAAVLTVWSMVYYLQKALPEIRARVR